VSALGALAAWEPGDGVVLRSAMHHRFRAAGATFERRGAWEVPVAIPEETARLERVGFADASSLTKLELRSGDPPPAEPDRAVVTVAPGRWIAICRPDADLGRPALDMTGAWSLLAIAGPEAPRLLRRLGPVAEVPGAGPLAGVPGRVLRRHDVIWTMAASEFAQHLFDACADLCAPLGGGPVGLDAIARATADPLLGGLEASAAR
jgi:glycine cleavage system aminomethyltransferase T